MRYLACSDRWLRDYWPNETSLVGRSHYEEFPEIPERWKEIHRRGMAGEVVRAEEDPSCGQMGERNGCGGKCALG